MSFIGNATIHFEHFVLAAIVGGKLRDKLYKLGSQNAILFMTRIINYTSSNITTSSDSH